MLRTLSFQRIGVASLVCASLLITACSKQPPAVKAPPPAVVVAPVQQEQVQPSYEAVGRTAANENVDVRSRVTGHLLKRLFHEGQQVKAGQLLFEIDPAPYQEEVARYEAQLARSKAESDVARLNFNRGKTLVSKGTISKAEMDDLTSKKLQAAANVKADEASLASAKLNLSYTKIYAPVAGTVGRSEVSIGDLITANNDTMVNLVNMDPMYVYFQISENVLLQFRSEANKLRKEGHENPPVIAKLRLSNGSLYDQNGKIDFLDNRIDPNTGTIQVRAVFPNPNRMLLPGQYVTVISQRTETKTVLTIPQVAIQEDQRGKFVLVVGSDDVAQVRKVTTGETEGTNIIVSKGLKLGEKVITEGLQKVRPGSKVNPAERPADSPQPEQQQ